jgi:hypothetical protein
MPGFSQPAAADAPEVRLGALAQGGLAPAIMAIVERGVTRRPDRARALGIEVELRMEESYPRAPEALGHASGAWACVRRLGMRRDLRKSTIGRYL